ncbi:uncharacterized protein FMAN_12770 [Fusarium mangiferae]|uniref:Uncharacterized protein n=1 Tax=Fusarium mangiferae TaxID=192010 RepID=A0A1L7U2Y9_FUSMA|nr:uncharacterized protein FMAN_12770 [Fusarium mangiferae]CVL04659.1 uncharacterized protein FMAN_12770 [Fusarium mangiferae]
MGLCLFPFGGLVSCVQTFLGVSTAVMLHFHLRRRASNSIQFRCRGFKAL